MEGTFAILSNEHEHWFWNFERALRAIWSVVRSASWVERRTASHARRGCERRPVWRAQFFLYRSGAPRPMKRGTIASPWRYDAAAADAKCASRSGAHFAIGAIDGHGGERNGRHGGSRDRKRSRPAMADTGTALVISRWQPMHRAPHRRRRGRILPASGAGEPATRP